MEAETSTYPNLTKYPLGSLRELISLAFPLVLSLFSISFMGFCSRIFLVHYSFESLQAYTIASYLCQLFQQPLMRITTMAQVFVGLYRGSNNSHQIGQSIWQMIWFSFLSMIITLPVGYFLAPYFFEGAAIKESACSYFYVQMSGNFLFPLGAALTSFFIGQGKTRVIFLTTLCAHILNIGLDRLFILGIDGYFPAMGAFGASLAICIAQGVFCISLFILFLKKEYRITFQTMNFYFKRDIFWHQMRISVPRAFARMILLTAWAAVVRLITVRGDEYLLVLSIGSSIIILFTFINDGMCQALITIASHIMGSKNYAKIWKMVRSAILLIIIEAAILAVPYVLFPNFILSFFPLQTPSPELIAMLKHACIWLWLYFFFYGYNGISFSLVTAARDVNFYMFVITFVVWLTSYIPVYCAMNIWHCSADKLWLIMALDSAIIGTIFMLRSLREKWKEQPTFSLNKALSSNL